MIYRIIVTLIISSLIFPQEKNFNVQQITVKDGLSQSSVYSIIQDHHGFLWFGTGDGLNRYDGYQIKVYRHSSIHRYSLSNNAIRGICEDNAGKIWLNTDKGLNIFDPTTNKFYNHFNSGSKKVFDILQGYDINNLSIDKNNLLWFTSNDFVISYDQFSNRLTKYKLSNSNGTSLNDLFIDKMNNVWASVKNKLYLFDKELNKFNLQNLTTQNKITSIDFIFNDDKGDLFLLNSNKSIIKISSSNYNVSEIALKLYTQNSLRGKLITNICNRNRNHYLLTISDEGFFDLDVNNGIVNSINISSNIASTLNYKSIYCIYKDKSNILWLGTDEGVNKINFNIVKFPHYFINSSAKQFPKGNYIKSLYKDSKGILWIGTYDYGLNKINKSKGVTSTFNSKNTTGVYSNSFYCTYEDKDGNLWFGSNNYLYKKNKNIDRFTAYPIEGTINSITEYPQGKLWLGTTSGLMCFNTDINKFTPMGSGKNKPRLYIFNNIWTIYNDGKGDLYLGTYGNGLEVYNINKNSVNRYINNQTELDEISDNTVKTICPDPDSKDVLWIGTDDGLNKFDIKNLTFKSYFENDGLPNDYIYGILSDNNGNLWISTNRGISKLNRKQMAFRNFSVSDGLQSYEFNSGAYFKDKDGSLYFGGINGYNIFYPDSILDNYFTPQIVLTNIRKFDENFNPGCDPSEVKEINLKYNENTIGFEFAALEFTDPVKNMYSIKLEGFDQDWVNIKTKRQVRYTNLSPGRYIFKVKASNNDGIWNPKPLIVAVNIIPPVWKTSWFRFTGVIFMLIMLSGLISYLEKNKYRKMLLLLEQQAALNKERIRISNDMHDDVGSVLTKISLLLSSLWHKNNFPETQKTILEKITASNNEVIQKLDEIVWALNPKNDNLKNLSEYISEYAEEFFDSSSIKCYFDFPNDVTPIPLSSEVRHNVFLVFKEILNNIVKHSEADKAFIKLIEGKDAFTLVIQDNGKGFDTSENNLTRNGLKNMKERILVMDGKFSIESVPTKGTKIEFTLLLKD